MNPDISVVMAVYNTEETMLRQAIESILDQSFRAFEFIIVLDCPTDGSDAIVAEYAARDPRIRMLPNPQNMGLAYSLNAGVASARGKYIARMDSDDLALPQRFQVQYDYMEANPGVAVAGARVVPFGVEVTQPYPVQAEWIADQDLLKIRMLFRNVGVPHPTAMIRKSVLDAHGLNYDRAFRKSQDYRLWVDIMQHGHIVMLPQVLLRYRIHPGQISAQRQSQGEYARRVSLMQITQLVGALSEQEQAIHFSATEVDLPENDHRAFGSYLDRISRCNREKGIYDQKKLDMELDYMWCQKAIRRALLRKDLRMLLTRRMLALLKPRVLGHYCRNLKAGKAYAAALQELVLEENG